MKTTMFGALGPWVAATAAAVLLAGCGLEKQTQPSLTGPSNGGLSITMTASPDSLPRDGSSRSVITITARDAQGAAVVGQRLTLTLGVNAPQGATVSTNEVTTNSSGQATFTVTAPVANSFGDITVLATPVGSDAANSLPRVVSIRALPENSAAPQFAATPFTVTCNGVSPCVTTPVVGEVVTFDGSCHPSSCSSSGVTDEGQPCNACSFTWNFGGDGFASGQIVRHQFTTPGTFVVTETVTDAGGSSAVAQQSIAVVADGGVPTATISSINPNPPVAGQPSIFTASATASTNHRIISYTWSWGDGSSDTTTGNTTVQHTFSDSGRFFVTLTVRDDLGQTMQAFQNVTVSSGLVASFIANQVPPNTNHQVNFDASASVSNTGTKITTYTWDFGDGGVSDSGNPTTTHSFAAAGSYTVKLTITDDRGRTASTQQSVTVQ